LSNFPSSFLSVGKKQKRKIEVEFSTEKKEEEKEP